MLFGGLFLVVAIYVLNTTHKPLISAGVFTGLVAIVGLLTGLATKQILTVLVINLLYMSIFFLLLVKISENKMMWQLTAGGGVILWLFLTYKLKNV